MIIAGAVPIMQELGGEISAIGVVDAAAVLAPVEQVDVMEQSVTVFNFADVASARQAWQSGDIDSFLVVPDQYPETTTVEIYSERTPNARITAAANSILRRGLLPDQPDAFYERFEDPISVEYFNLDRSQHLSQGLEIILKVAAPIVLGLMFATTVMTGMSQIGMAVVQEKDQRSMEMIITSVSPAQLMAGKLIGMTLLTLTQVGIWLLGAALGLGLAFGDQFASGQVSIPWQALLWGLLLGGLGYLFYAILAAGVGVVAGDRQQAQQMTGILGFVGLFPLWFLGPIIQNPSEPVAVFLTIFPLTGPLVGLIRLGLSAVPLWQLLAGLAVLALSIVAGVLIVARIFRASMLMFGQRMGLRQILQALRQAGS
jgi:ABC-2 type transport system permease protein